MVPIAGDGSLLHAAPSPGLSVAEQVKRQLKASPIHCQDVVGNDLEPSRKGPGSGSPSGGQASQAIAQAGPAAERRTSPVLASAAAVSR